MRIILLCFLLTGCATRLTDEQITQLSQGKADIEAARLTVDAEAFQALMKAGAARVMAALANLELPIPATPVSDLVEKNGNPIPVAIEAESKAAAAAEETPPSGLWGMIAAGAGGVGLLALSVLRFSPGAFGLVANLAHTFLAPKATKEMRAAEREAVAITHQAVAYGHAVTTLAETAGLKPSVEAVKTQFSEAQDALGIRDQMGTILQAFKDGKLPVKPS